jgi:hypothetical protein
MVWFVVCPVIGGSLGWLAGRFERRKVAGTMFEDITGDSWTGAIFGVVIGILIAAIINARLNENAAV